LDAEAPQGHTVIEHIAAHQGAWMTIAVALVILTLLLQKRRRDAARWNAAHPHRSFGGSR
jgi:hypothetical protein